MNYRLFYIILIISVVTSCRDTNNIPSIQSVNKDLVLVNGVLELNKVPFSGRLISNFFNGNLKSEMFYKDGKKNGSEKYWLENGDLAQERFYTNGLKTGIHSAWWNLETPKFVYHFNNQGEFDGEVKEWYRSGQLYMHFNYKKGKESGSQRLWKIDGSVKANYEVVNGERFGLIGLKKCYQVTTGSDVVK
ncbi:MAG: hypothetical protein ABJL44_06055 [Algibacter sp.]